MAHLQEKHPLAIRWFHWISFPLLFLMIWSGLLVYWANDVYRVGWGGTTLFRFFPDWFYQGLNIPQRLAEGMALHFFFMWLFAANGAFYLLYLAFSGEWRNVLPDRHSLRDAVHVTLHDLHLRKKLPPQGLYNGAQRIAYTSVIAMAMGSVITGLAIYKPAQLSWLTGLLGGYPHGALGALLVDDRVCQLLCGSRRTGDSRGVGQFPVNGGWLFFGAGRGGAS